jgi:hypothetical protein
VTEMYPMQSPATGHLAFRFTLGREKRGYGCRSEQRNQAPAGELKNQAARELRGKLHAAITISDPIITGLKPVLLKIQIFARRDDFGQRRHQGLKPLIPAMIVGTTEVVP